jgi:hypothetical protein
MAEMKLRWLESRRKLTADMVKEYSEKHSVSMMTAKHELQRDNTSMVLQYYDDDNEIWFDIDHVVEYFE